MHTLSDSFLVRYADGSILKVFGAEIVGNILI